MTALPPFKGRIARRRPILSYPKNTTPGRFSLGRNLSSYKLIIGKRGVQGKVTGGAPPPIV